MTNKLKLLLSSPFLLLLLFTFNPVKVFGQGTKITPDCVVFINVTLAAQVTVPLPTVPTAGGAGDNRTEGCQSWTLEYQAVGAGALTSVDFQAGQSSTTTVTFATWAGTVDTGINPNTSSTGATSTFSTGCASMAVCTIPDSWVQVLITRGTFVGTINGVLYGYKTGPKLSVSATIVNSSCPGTVATPCVVDGPDAASAVPTKFPVAVAGLDGLPGGSRHIQPLTTDTNGALIPSSASVANTDSVPLANNSPVGAGTTVLFYRGLPYVFNGSTYDRQFSCIFQAVAVLAPGTTGVLITGVMGATTKICHMHLSDDTAAGLLITSGTGSNCGSSTVTIDSYTNVTAFAMDFSPLSPLKANASGDDICYTFSTSVAHASLTVIYAQY